MSSAKTNIAGTLSRSLWGELDEAQFAHLLSHGLSSILGSLAWMKAELERSGDAVPEALRTRLLRCLGNTAIETESQLHQACALLQYLMPDYLAGLLRPKFVYRSPMDLLRAMVPAYEGSAAKKQVGIDLVHESDEALFPSIVLEENSLRRAFHHVLSNAVKYSYRGATERSRFLRIWCERHDADARLWAIKIQNYGLGISDEERQAVFEPGFRGEMAERDNTFGTGLGLTDALFCMQLHNGYIHLRSKPLPGENYVTTVALVFRRKTNVRRNFTAARGVGRS